MSFTIEELNAQTDAQIIALHDAAAVHTVVGTDYYMNELHRRSLNRSATANNRLALANTLLALVAAIAAVIALTQ